MECVGISINRHRKRTGESRWHSPTLATCLSLALRPSGAPLWQTTYANFAPRIGVAYEVSQSRGHEVVVRGGIGMSYDTAGGQTGYAFTNSYPYLSGQSVFNTPFPRVSSLVSTPEGVPYVGFDPNLKLPYVLNWSFSVDQALGSNQLLSVAYVGSSGRRLLQTQTLFNPSPDFSYLRLTTNGATSGYRALQVQFTRRLSSGLEAMAAYTWSRSLDNQNIDSPARTLLQSNDPYLEVTEIATRAIREKNPALCSRTSRARPIRS